MYRTKRAYEPPDRRDGVRVLVDRIWPRGRSSAELRIDHWPKDLAPSTALRKWFKHDPRKWDEFRARYAEELDKKPDAVASLLSLDRGRVTLVYAARDGEHNNAVALAAYLAQVTARPTSGVRRSSTRVADVASSTPTETTGSRVGNTRRSRAPGQRPHSGPSEKR